MKPNINGYFMPDEAAPHLRSWMAFIASHDIWSEKQIPEVQRNLILIAKTVAKYEPVSVLVRKQDMALAVRLLGDLEANNYPIDLIQFEMDDLWLRDTGPVFVIDQQQQAFAIDFNFNGWGQAQEYALDAKVAAFIAQYSGLKRLQSSLTLEAGCFELDGKGLAIMTKSCLLNDNRNPNISKTQLEAELKKLLGLEKIIWLKGIKGKDITDSHTDFYARFAHSGLVLVSRDNDERSYDYALTRENIVLLEAASDAKGKALKLVIIDSPEQINESFGVKDFAAGYIGYYLCNGAVIMQKFGDKKHDRLARDAISKAFPKHAIEQIAIDAIASGGGSIHCATLQQPLF